MPHRKREAKLREFAQRLSDRIDELRKEPPGAAASLRHAFREFADSVPSIIWTAGPDGVVTFLSRHYYDFFGVADMNWQDITHPEDCPAVIAAWADAVAGGMPYCNTARMRDAAGHYHTIITRAQPVRSDGHRIVYWIGSSNVVEPSVIRQVA